MSFTAQVGLSAGSMRAARTGSGSTRQAAVRSTTWADPGVPSPASVVPSSRIRLAGGTRPVARVARAGTVSMICGPRPDAAAGSNASSDETRSIRGAWPALTKRPMSKTVPRAVSEGSGSRKTLRTS